MDEQRAAGRKIVISIVALTVGAAVLELVGKWAILLRFGGVGFGELAPWAGGVLLPVLLAVLMLRPIAWMRPVAGVYFALGGLVSWIVLLQYARLFFGIGPVSITSLPTTVIAFYALSGLVSMGCSLVLLFNAKVRAYFVASIRA